MDDGCARPQIKRLRKPQSYKYHIQCRVDSRRDIPTHDLDPGRLTDFPDAICDMRIGEIILVAEPYHLNIGGLCVIWHAEVRRVTGESTLHMGRGQHDGGDHSVSYVTRVRESGNVHSMCFVAWIDYTRWHLKIFPTANGKVPQPMKRRN